MPDLLLEIYSEEIPAKMQFDAEKGYLRIFKKYLSNYSYSSIDVFSTACRIILHVQGLKPNTKISLKQIKGPKISAPKVAVDGFCKKYSVQTSDLIVQDEYYVLNITREGLDLSNYLSEMIPKIIMEYVWPKTMKWGKYNLSWVRPIKNILCIYDNKILPFVLGHISSNNITFGHKFLSSNLTEINNWSSFESFLLQNRVLISRDTRKSVIIDEIAKIEKDLNCQVNIDENLLEEIIGLVDFPKVLVGNISEKHMGLPSELLILTMNYHQKFLSCNKGNSITNKFVFISNIHNNDDNIISDNEKVLAARLDDAYFIYEQDRNMKIQDWIDKLKNVVFFNGLGTMHDKSERLAKMVEYISDDKDLLLASKLCKLDLVSNVVSEFPELQGIIGGYYFKDRGNKVSEIISLHYLPQKMNDEVPNNNTSLLSLADKLDNIVGLFIVGQRATSSKDPLGLRRMAIGIIRLYLENNFDFVLRNLIKKSISLYNTKDKDVFGDIIDFLYERFRFILHKSFEPRLVNAILSNNTNLDFVLIRNKIQLLSSFDISNIINIYKRLAHFSSPFLEGNIVIDLFATESEKNIYNFLIRNLESTDIVETKYGFKALLESQQDFSIICNDFLDNTLINHPEEDIALNRLLIIKMSIEFLELSCNWKDFIE